MRDENFEQKCANASILQLKEWYDGGRFEERKKRVIANHIRVKEEEARQADRAEELAIQL